MFRDSNHGHAARASTTFEALGQHHVQQPRISFGWSRITARMEAFPNSTNWPMSITLPG
jgi:hypothetical protein